MRSITVTDHHVICENSAPHIRTRHGYFPGAAKLPSGDLLTFFVLGEAMDATNITTKVSRSGDQDRTCVVPGPLFERTASQRHYSNYLKPIVLSDDILLVAGLLFPTWEGTPPVNQVLVRTIPETSHKSFYRGTYASHFVGWPLEKDRALLKELLVWSTQEQLVYQRKW